jgi:hypothetical protein
MKIIDPGHRYELLCIDGKEKNYLQFVKRFDPKDPAKYPGNADARPGTTLQDVIQCCLNRFRYLQNQIPCIENEVCISNMQQCLLMLEQRAAKRHGLEFDVSRLEVLEFAPLCKTCGHTVCEHPPFQ